MLTRPQAGRQRRGQNRLGGTNGTRPHQPPELTLCPGCGEASEACAERALLPRLREAAPGAVVLAGGFSCRTQIHELDSGGREAMHLAELLATADHPERTAAPPPGPATPDGQGRRPGRNRRCTGRRRGDSGRRRRGGPLGAHPRRRSQGK